MRPPWVSVGRECTTVCEDGVSGPPEAAGCGMNPKSEEQQGAEGFLTAFGMTVRGRATAGDMEPIPVHPQRARKRLPG